MIDVKELKLILKSLNNGSPLMMGARIKSAKKFDLIEIEWVDMVMHYSWVLGATTIGEDFDLFVDPKSLVKCLDYVKCSPSFEHITKLDSNGVVVEESLKLCGAMGNRDIACAAQSVDPKAVPIVEPPDESWIRFDMPITAELWEAIQTASTYTHKTTEAMLNPHIRSGSIADGGGLYATDGAMLFGYRFDCSDCKMAAMEIKIPKAYCNQKHIEGLTFYWDKDGCAKRGVINGSDFSFIYTPYDGAYPNVRMVIPDASTQKTVWKINSLTEFLNLSSNPKDTEDGDSIKLEVKADNPQKIIAQIRGCIDNKPKVQFESVLPITNPTGGSATLIIRLAKLKKALSDGMKYMMINTDNMRSPITMVGEKSNTFVLLMPMRPDVPPKPATDNA